MTWGCYKLIDMYLANYWFVYLFQEMNDDADVVSTPQYNEDGEEPTEDNIYSKMWENKL